MVQLCVMKPTNKVTQERLKEVLTYDPDTGSFTWNQIRPAIKVGDRAGFVRRDGYRQVKIDAKPFLCGRLAFIYMTGEDPEEIDHINHNRSDDSWVNLRGVTSAANMLNKSKYKNNTSGTTGVYLNKQHGKWRAEFTVKGVKTSLGFFNTKEEAVAARRAADKINAFHINHGQP